MTELSHPAGRHAVAAVGHTCATWPRPASGLFMAVIAADRGAGSSPAAYTLIRTTELIQVLTNQRTSDTSLTSDDICFIRSSSLATVPYSHHLPPS